MPVQCRVLSLRPPRWIYLACKHTGADLQLEGAGFRTSLLKHFEMIAVSATGHPGSSCRTAGGPE